MTDNTQLAAELAALQDHARKMSIALTNLSGGGSEMFTRIGEDFYADPEACLARLAEKQANRDRRAALTKPAVPDVVRLAIEDADALDREAEGADEANWQDWGALMRQAAIRIRALAALTQPPTCCEAEREALDAASVVIDYAASILWNCRPEGRAARPARVDAALRQFRIATAIRGADQ